MEWYGPVALVSSRQIEKTEINETKKRADRDMRRVATVTFMPFRHYVYCIYWYTQKGR